MTATTSPRQDWTIAYRNPRANAFRRVDLTLTWDQAMELGGRVAETTGLQVYSVSTVAAEGTGRVATEDVANVMVASGRRVKIKEGGELPAGVEPLSAEEAARLGEEPVAESASEQPVEEAAADAVIGWTVAYRTADAKRFRRVPVLALSEDDATALSVAFVTAYPNLEVYALANRQAELDGLVEDGGFVTVDSGKRVKIVETGEVPAEVTAAALAALAAEQPVEAAEEAAAPAAAPAAEEAAEAAEPTEEAAEEPVAAPPAAPTAKPSKRVKRDRKPKVTAPKVTAPVASTTKITVTRVTEGGKRDLVATVNGEVVGTAVGYNDVKPNGAHWFKGWKIMAADGKKQLGHVVFQVGVAKAEAKLLELVAA